MMHGRGQSESTAAVSHGSSVMMYMPGSVSWRLTIILVLTVFVILANCRNAVPMEMAKCCSSKGVLTEHLTCVNRSNMNETGVLADEPVNRTFFCPENESLIVFKEYDQSDVTLPVENASEKDLCVDDTINGRIVLVKCTDHSSSILGLGSVVFWGAQTYMSTNLAHMILCIAVIIVYLSVPELGRGLYNRAVVRHTICLLMQGVTLQLLGYCELNDWQINDHLMIFIWLVLQYFTIATVFWLNGICFDMTLAIIRFQWVGHNAHKSGEGEERKLLMYSVTAWGGSLLPTLLAGLCDYIPQVPSHFILKPNYLNYKNGQSTAVSLYFFLLPAVILLLNNVLFVCTTWRIIRIQRSTEMATRNQRNILRKKYFLFLRLYLLMGAPWFFGMLLACLNILIVLKICRLIQPVLWLLMLTTHRDLRRRVKEAFSKCRHENKGGNCTPPTTVSSNF